MTQLEYHSWMNEIIQILKTEHDCTGYEALKILRKIIDENVEGTPRAAVLAAISREQA